MEESRVTEELLHYPRLLREELLVLGKEARRVRDMSGKSVMMEHEERGGSGRVTCFSFGELSKAGRVDGLGYWAKDFGAWMCDAIDG